ncbi:cytochrome c family protein [Pseudaminobacter sp. 19-2017]|uniref:Cytochrome c family protein n=1 Tax=Pseudaminobacter soli (ex Zhang et al. 2022) TaxID=2831468 RepID=A0A942I8L3_9HYPH|nr:cytochrome c family protein [Pseudaminobacter soli]MBS3648351.1 cytochrome c family protein [Pseudaminobacter soli]
MRFAVAFVATSTLLLVTAHAQAQDAAAGEKIFARCKACHEADVDKNKVGPSLKGVVGRKAGTHEGFKYSTAMQEAGQKGIVWDEANITSYLKDPKAFIPGNKMAFPGLKKDDEIANVIAYLKQHM